LEHFGEEGFEEEKVRRRIRATVDLVLIAELDDHRYE